MRKIAIGTVLLFGLALLDLAIGSSVHSLSETVVIRTVQVRDAISSTNESITLTNNTSGDIDITNWCLEYASSSTSVEDESSISWRTLACAKSADEVTHIMLPPHQSALAVSVESGWEGDMEFSATLSNSSGHVRLVNGEGQEVDRIGWGDARYPETVAAASPTIGKMLQRLFLTETSGYVDTDNNLNDFELLDEQRPQNYGMLYEASDICQNISGLQSVIPENHVLTDTGECLPFIDHCQNIDGVQLVLPEHSFADEDGNCYQDVCINIDDVQTSIPDGYKLVEGICFINVLPLLISEVLANASGPDEGNEFIELFNPNDSVVYLSSYILYVGKNLEHVIEFSLVEHIDPGDYYVIYNDSYDFILPNTTTQVVLTSLDGLAVFDMPTYDHPKDDIAWASINGEWQYTNRPTPGQENQEWYQSETVAPVTLANKNLKPCAENQYRNPATNRCKLIESTDGLTPCGAGQYRSSETNRCRSIRVSNIALAPCQEGKERNPATNRCRSVLSSTSGLVPCDDGQERNPDTNRCRKVAASEIPKAGYAIKNQGSSNASPSYLIIAIIIIAILGMVYATWEWRQDIGRLFKKFWSVVRFRK